MPNALLGRYFAAREVLGELDFAAMSETRHDALLAAWLALSEGQRNVMDAELCSIFELSCKKGFRAVLDEAQWHLDQDDATDASIAFTQMLAVQANHFARAMVTYLDYSQFLVRCHALSAC